MCRCIYTCMHTLMIERLHRCRISAVAYYTNLQPPATGTANYPSGSHYPCALVYCCQWEPPRIHWAVRAFAGQDRLGGEDDTEIIDHRRPLIYDSIMHVRAAASHRSSTPQADNRAPLCPRSHGELHAWSTGCLTIASVKCVREM